MPENNTRIDEILAICDAAIGELGPTTADSLAAIEGSVYDELNTDVECGFMTVDERDIAFAAWCERYSTVRGLNRL